MRTYFSILALVLSFLPARGMEANGVRQDVAPTGQATRLVLSLTWLPGFCASRTGRQECDRPGADDRAAAAFALYGLWQPRRSYCSLDAGVAETARKARWTDLPPLALDAALAARLSQAMPGVVSGLDRHQWLRNGTCVAALPTDYYRQGLGLLDAVNASAVPGVLAARAGGAVTLAEVRAAFDASFGRGAGERVRLACRTVEGRTFVVGLTIGLGAGAGDLAARLAAAKPTRSRCAAGLTGGGRTHGTTHGATHGARAGDGLTADAAGKDAAGLDGNGNPAPQD
ncbi:ribonuclease [Rhizobium sp. TRM95111]|uniref:ribonuclease T2 family protein n=1 Tax=Rhizobium alarense TaxID=2846851 RepID=UPI001F4228E9|nr:ribonuclease [Rhizobium alarense]MCF3639349.1 ribonuclease [Rhizobium alarense]